MHLVDTTMFFAPQSGAVKRYLLAKQHWLRSRQPSVQHTLLVPGQQSAIARCGLETVAAPSLPLSQGYRFPVRGTAWMQRLIELRPDLIEAGDPYRLAWVVLDAAQ